MLLVGMVYAQNPPPPDYSNLDHWAVHPGKKDNGDSIPAFVSPNPAEKTADLFFIHPTSYFDEAPDALLNARLDDETVNFETDSRSILFQSTVFNGSCRMFAPRYRQANMEAFYIMGTPKANAAFDLAYSDVKAAFLYYLEHQNKGRPVVIGAHSQGTLHAIRLLQEFFDGTPLQKQLVCAYIPGYRIRRNVFKTIPVGTSPAQTGCFVTWRSYLKGEIPERIIRENGDAVCVNPLTWASDTLLASSELHLGIMYGFSQIVPHTVAASIEPQTKILWIEAPDEIVENVLKRKDLHIYDINLFWMNIRENVEIRIQEFIKKNSP